MGVGLGAAKASGIAACVPKSGFLSKIAFQLRFQIEINCFRGGFWPPFETGKYCKRSRRTSHAIPASAAGFSPKMHAQGTLGRQFTRLPPQRELGCELGLNPLNHREFQICVPNPDFGPKWRFGSVSKLKIAVLERF